ncbi:phage tail protein [Paraburkholderia sp. GAS334]|uniref:phage tail protein n=1 Tax=Paraburkholderia sp. GAS334 TaxID=3035131 RepID=UPI003D1B73A2
MKPPVGEAAMDEERGTRLLNSLPAIYRAADESGQLCALLGAFEAILLESDDPKAPAIAQQIDALPALFAPLGAGLPGHPQARTPDRFLPWLAQWVAFEPYRLFSGDRLRTIIGGMVVLHGRRGTRRYLIELLKLCFDGIDEIRIDENPVHGFTIGLARLGQDSVLIREAPYCFRIEIAPGSASSELQHEPWQSLEQRVRAVVDFAKPAHTVYDLVLRRGTTNAKETATP